jgi:hypothetical protein
MSGGFGLAGRNGGEVAEASVRLSGRRGRRLGRGHGAVPTTPLWRGALAGAGTWQPRGDGTLMSGPDAERKRLTGGTPWQ